MISLAQSQERSIPESDLQALRLELQYARLPTSLAKAQWTESARNGLCTNSLEILLSYWKTENSWRKEEQRLNNLLPQFITPLQSPSFNERFEIHFIHRTSTVENTVPLPCSHGYPGSFIETSQALSLLNDAGFDVVAPSLAGWTFSSYTWRSGFGINQHAEIGYRLMRRLGYEKYVVQGNDWGANIGPALAMMHPENVSALHLDNVSSCGNFHVSLCHYTFLLL